MAYSWGMFLASTVVVVMVVAVVVFNFIRNSQSP